VVLPVALDERLRVALQQVYQERGLPGDPGDSGDGEA
jgi:hypothetical protein